ncbi:MAG: glycosyltransferase family 4 protein [Rhodocyclaceae bacterium]|jgi:glycosyltransferase involved in cell wall biosynthesis|nr:glycosyltransferase family 4 protein [Rhodocyclaceae bacterium]
MKKWRLAYLVSHPIQYQAPLLRKIAASPDIVLKVFFCSDFSLRKFADPEFGRSVQWDVPLVEGYEHEFLPSIGPTDKIGRIRPLVYGLTKRLREGRFDALWVHGWMHWSHIWAIHVAKQLGIKVLIRGEANLYQQNGNTLKKWIKDRFLRWLVANTDAFLAIGSWNREFYLHYGAKPEQIFLMPYAVDNDFFQKKAAEASSTRDILRASLGLEPGRRIILYASKLTARKRAMDLLEAYARLTPDGHTEPEPYLLFIGDGELRPALEGRARELGWKSIRFLGFKNQTELPRYYNLCDVFVLPSFQEPWGLVVNEVMNAGKAVIVSDQVGAGADLVRAGKEGAIFAAGNAGALARALAFLLEGERYIEMGKCSVEAINHWGFREDIAALRLALAAVGDTA